jgi:hypothetical protein
VKQKKDRSTTETNRQPCRLWEALKFIDNRQDQSIVMSERMLFVYLLDKMRQQEGDNGENIMNLPPEKGKSEKGAAVENERLSYFVTGTHSRRLNPTSRRIGSNGP